MGVVSADTESGNSTSPTMRRKLIIWAQRHRRSLTVVVYFLLLSVLAVLAFVPSFLDAVLAPLIGGRSPVQVTDSGLYEPVDLVGPKPTPTAATAVVRKVFDLPFVPQRDFLCDEMHLKAGRNFTYPEGYMDHSDAYKSALTLNDIIDQASPNEQSWILQDIAQLPFARTACETGFNAGHHAFHMLTANYDLVVHSFEDLRRHNYTLEMTDFMSIEFPDRFYVYDGEPRRSMAQFISTHGNGTSCDVIVVDGSQPRDVVRDYFLLLRQLASRRDNVVLMNAHPRNVHRSPYGADAVWEEMLRDGRIIEQFRCHFDASDLSPNQMGLLVGSFVF